MSPFKFRVTPHEVPTPRLKNTEVFTYIITWMNIPEYSGAFTWSTTHSSIVFFCYTMLLCSVYAFECVSMSVLMHAHLLHFVPLFPSCRLLETIEILDQVEEASLTCEREEWRFTSAPCWCWCWCFLVGGTLWQHWRIVNVYSSSYKEEHRRQPRAPLVFISQQFDFSFGFYVP